MIRTLSKSLGYVVNSVTFLYPPRIISPLIKRFDFTEILDNAKKAENIKLDELKRIRQAEMYIWHSLGYIRLDPAELTEEQWQHICGLRSKHQRQKFGRYLLAIKEAKAKQKKVHEEKRESSDIFRAQIREERRTNTHIIYGIGHSSLILRIKKQTMNSWLNSKLHRAKLYGQKIIVDCSYEDYLTELEKFKVVKGLKRLYGENRKHSKPLDVHLCGVKPDSAIFKNLCGQIPSLSNKKGSPTGIHTECFTDIYPKGRLVILTPDSDNVLKYNSNDIYIVGGIVELGRSNSLTLAKAKKLGIRTARLPLENLRLEAGDRRELDISSIVAVVRECQVNKNMNEIINKCVFLSSKRAKEKEETEAKEHEVSKV